MNALYTSYKIDNSIAKYFFSDVTYTVNLSHKTFH